ncbi:Hypothetical protein A7982_08912 [Minicystis rosea]|nr:Hypothetical protein A7982_08912 [Minicystis rosea]
MGSPTHFASIVLVSLVLVGSRSAMAQTKGAHERRASASPALDRKAQKALRDKLAGAPAEIAEGLAEAERLGKAAVAAAPDIEAILRRGSQAPILEASLRALAAIGVPSSSVAVAPYVRHRAPALRRAAALALARLPSAVSAAALREGLRGGDAQLRGIAATGLGAIGAREAVPDLLLALDRDVPEASAAVGRLCGPEACKRFAERIGRLGIEVMSKGIDAILLRESELPEDLLIGVVSSVRELGTPEARRYLAETVARFPASGSKRVKQALEGIVEARGAKP